MNPWCWWKLGGIATKLDLVLQYHPRTTTKEIPFSLSYGFEATVPVELAMNSPRAQFFAPEENERVLKHHLDEVEEKGDLAQLRIAAY